MELTEEQRKQAEANRLAAIAKRKALIESSTSIVNIHYRQNHDHYWRLTKCPKLANDNAHIPKRPQDSNLAPVSNTKLCKKFQVRLEICSPDSFSVTPGTVQGCPYQGVEECLRRLRDILSDVTPSHYTQNSGGEKACVYNLRDYGSVLSCLRKSKDIEIKEIPHLTLRVIETFSHCFVTGQWIPCRPEHLSEEDVDELIGKLPRTLLDRLLPFQLDGIRFGLQRGGRCLIADEMGLGKTLQAIAIAGCFMNEGCILVVCPAVLRYSWAEELERWLPCCLPSDIHLVFGHRDNPAYLKKCPRVVVISYTMLKHLRKSMLEQEWALLIVDESHHLRCSQKASESGEIQTVLDLAERVRRIVLLSGTPSLSRPYDIFHQINMLWPGLLGENKYKFAETYCAVNLGQSSQGFKDFSKGIRLEELNVLLSQTVMIRRLKEHVLGQLPPKRRQLIRLQLKRSDIASAKAAISFANGDDFEKNASKDTASENLEENHDGERFCNSRELSYQELGVAKLRGFREWFSIHPLIAKSDAIEELDPNSSSHKMIIFAHHHKVLDGIQEFICEKGIGFVRIDGTTLPKDRQSAVLSFQSSNGVKIAIIGITAGGVGLDFSSAQNVVFLELPQSPSLMLQAEDRAHRRGQTSAVNIYIFCAKDTMDESYWQSLNKSLHRVSSTTNGKYDAMQEIEVEGISYLVTPDGSCKRKILRKAAPGKLSLDLEKMQDSECFLDMQLSEACADATVQMNDLSVGINQNYGSYLHNDGGMVPDLLINKDLVCMEDKNELHPSAADIGICEVAPPLEMNKINKDRDPLPKGQTITADYGVPIQLLDDECCSNQVNSLRFEVSQYTGRIHLYSCIPGTDLRPRPLFQNFRPEEIESEDALTSDNKETVSKYFKDNPAYRHALWVFVNDWNKLRPIEQRKLHGKPLQLPLSVELWYLKESINHDRGGLLKGGSKRRTTPLCEISISLPPNAVWKKVHLRGSCRKKEREYTQGWTLTDEPLCKLCQKPCKGRSAKTPEYFEDLFCNLGCYEEYRLRTSNRSIRQELFQIEHGICSNCQLDCHQLVKHLKPLSSERRREYIAKVAPKIASQKSLVDKLVSDPSEGNVWHADHIVPVYRGGGECRLENMRTLCVACHADVTAVQCAERSSMRIKAKKNLKAIMSDLRNAGNIEKNASCRKDQGPSEMIKDITDDELLVNVPGSAYTGGKSSSPQTKDLKDCPTP
ncbi:SNF2 domain-containing protein / helicase domain-containing protein / HNH endonuclease domain-containing protein, putative isoform 1 [Theobroma cacao]|uniref:SNF2 domain-containing protein / helicase domain-containing protein / HNH endonuclease domain-containing protein, putative isoform 1 n=1 Tax=Theobroma cacao TaxID=3641 RepID=A0A061FY23_THECC|nr:SNF2 domain-containing protein / helicase domain-containing protein / HNH endonuclease domain-containing protein, putative isoform 1 [Theobroma cacao]